MSWVDPGTSGERSYMRPVPETASGVHERQKAVEAPARPGSRSETSCNAANGAPRSSDSRSPWGAEWESRWRPRPITLSPPQPEHPQGRPWGGWPRKSRVSAEVVGEMRSHDPNGTPDGLFTLRQMASQSSKGAFVLSRSSVMTKRVLSVSGSTEGRHPMDKGST